MKPTRLFVLLTVVCAVFAASVTTEGQSSQTKDCDLIVVGQNSPGLDVPNVSAAVNGPHSSEDVTVCLQGVFDFGMGILGNAVFINPAHIDPPSVVNSLTIVGLDDSSNNQATIRNGFQPLRFPPASSLPVLRIDNLRFEQPLFTAISIFRGNELVEITRVHVDGVRTFVIELFDISFREGIVVASAATSIDGTIVIANNTVDAGPYDPLNPRDVSMTNFGIAILGQGPVNPFPITADVLVTRNVVRNWSGIGILSQWAARLTMEHNLVEPGAFANTPTNPAACVANGLGIINNDGAIARSNRVHKVPAARADGSTPACSAGILLSNANDNGFSANNVSGEGSHAINLLGPPASHNVFVGNKLAAFLATSATVNLGPNATDNTFAGNAGTVSGNIDANTITGLTPVAGGIGGEVSDIMHP